MQGNEFEWLGRKPDTLPYHLKNPGIHPEDYARAKRRSLGKQLMSIRRIYLDTKHWIHLRDVLMGRPRSSVHTKLFDTLAVLRDAKTAVCPISYSVFTELLRQTDADSRNAMAKAIDLFGDSACTQPPHELFRYEVFYFLLRSIAPGREQLPVSELVWTKAAFVLGDRFLRVTGLPNETCDAIQKAIDDLLWSLSLEEYISPLPSKDPLRCQDDIKSLASELTTGKIGAFRESDTFEDLFLQEVSGGLEPRYPILGNLMLDVLRGHNFTGQPPADEIREAGRALANLLYMAFKDRRVSTELPGIHIPAGLHAAVRLDRLRKYKPGDCEDFRHAVAALPYYDVFCTDKSLKHLLCHKPLGYDQAYATTIVCDEEETLQVLQDVR